MRRRYQGQSECPLCGMQSENLKPEALPFIEREGFDFVHLVCAICDYEWLQSMKTAELLYTPGLRDL